RGLLQELSAQERERWYQFSKRHESGLGTRADLAMFWADGKRDLLRIADLVEAESGHRDVAALVGYFRLLERLRLVRLETRRGRSGKNRMSEQAQTRRSRVRVRSRPST
ncbi:MAG: hypothetical protein ABIK62_08030, partial [candidate division WOR-3 bacterium]